mgnify:FL=1|tara:strand:+ start:237 stop:509 length:273 start_codon:yes stop_codon:yes gene_type:complete
MVIDIIESIGYPSSLVKVKGNKKSEDIDSLRLLREMYNSSLYDKEKKERILRELLERIEEYLLENPGDQKATKGKREVTQLKNAGVRFKI